jgi:hypothetical protein
MLHAQGFAVMLIVSGSALYASWSLMPSSLRRRLAVALLRWPLPDRFKAPLRRAVSVDSGACGGCGGCAGKVTKATHAAGAPTAASASATGARPMIFHRRLTR